MGWSPAPWSDGSGSRFARARPSGARFRDLPGTRRAPLGDLASVSLVREIGTPAARARGTPRRSTGPRLTRARGRAAGRRAAEGLGPSRWHAANRRIWRGYTRLAQRHLEAFELEAALPPLFRALHCAISTSARPPTRGAARAPSSASPTRRATISRLLKDGDREAAMQRWQDVRSLIQKSARSGLSHEQLAAASREPADARAIEKSAPSPRTPRRWSRKVQMPRRRPKLQVRRTPCTLNLRSGRRLMVGYLLDDLR